MRSFGKCKTWIFVSVSLLWICMPTAMAQKEPLSIQPTIQFPDGKDHVVIRWKWGVGLLWTDVVRINGKNVGWFLIGTGNQITCIDRKLIPHLGLPAIASSSNLESVHFGVKELDVGGVKLIHQAVLAPRLDELKKLLSVDLAGILGANFFRRFPFAVDYHKQTLTFYKRESFQAPKGSRAFDIAHIDQDPAHESLKSILFMDDKAGQPLVRGMIDQQRAMFQIDTGLSYTFLEGPFATKHEHFVSDQPSRFPFVSLSAEGKQLQCRFQNLQLWGQTTAKPPRAFAFMRPNPLGLKRDVRIGNDVLKHFQFGFDYENKKGWSIWKPYPSVKKQLADGMDPNAIDLGGSTPLIKAIAEGDLEGVQALIKAGGNTRYQNRVDSKVVGILEEALVAGHPKILKALLAAPNPPNPNAHLNKGPTLLMRAARFNEAEMIKLLIHAGAKLNEVSDKQWTALHFAAAANHSESIMALAKGGADPNRHNDDGRTPLAYAIYSGNVKAVEAILKAGGHWQVFNPAVVKNSVYHLAAHHGHVEIIRLIHTSKSPKKPPVDGLDGDAHTPLVVAILANKPEAVAAMLKIGANLNAAYRGPITVLDLGKISKNPKIRKLVEDAAKKQAGK